MAVALGAASATVSGGAASTSLTPVLPAFADNDIGWLIVRSSDNVAHVVPVDWTQAVAFNNGAAARLTLAWKRLVVGDANPTVTRTAPTGGWAAVVFLETGGRTTGDPYDVAPTTQGNAPALTATAASITATHATDLIVMLVGRATTTANVLSGWAATDPATLTERLDQAGGNANGFGVADGTQTVVGATGNGTATLTTSVRNEGIMLALVADTGGAPPSGAIAVTGGGTVAAVGTKGVSGVVPVTGGGAQAIVGRKGALSTVAITGGGTITVTGLGGGVRGGAIAVTGGGNVAFTGRKGVARTVAVTGGGTVTVTGRKGSPGTSRITGGGAVSLAGLKGSAAVVTITGGGSIAVTGIGAVGHGRIAIAATSRHGRIGDGEVGTLRRDLLAPRGRIVQ